MQHVDVAVIGAGFAGLYAHYRLRADGFSAAGFDAAADVGGTWYWNAYPGARCDLESIDYCYSFSRELLDEWRWSERYATQPEILRYINHVADRFDLRRDIRFSTRVTRTRFDDEANRWIVETDTGHPTAAQYLLVATGPLSLPKPPDSPGLQDFAGDWVQASTWPREPVRIVGKRVAVIGTGSSGIQSIPVIAEQAQHVTVFQRTPNFSIPDPFAIKEICLDSDYFETFNRPNVTLVDIRAEPIERITARGIRTAAHEYPFDLIVFATDFDAMTGPLLALNIEGAAGKHLKQAWRDGPATYLGLMISGFPNLFTVNGPGSPSVLANMVMAIEHHVDWIADAIGFMRRARLDRIDVEPAAQLDWVDEVRAIADRTLYPRANSWYNGDNVPGRKRVFPPYAGGLDTYISRCDELTAAGYIGFCMTRGAANRKPAYALLENHR